MTLVQMSGASSTSAGGAAMLGMNVIRAGAICLLFLFGDNAAQATTGTYKIDLPADQTDAHLRSPVYSIPFTTTGDAVLEIRRRSGLTWEEIGELFDVSRRSVHNWASGEVLAARNERHVRMVLSAIRHVDRGDPRATRDALMTVGAGGSSAFGLLKQSDLAAAVALAGGGTISANLRETFRANPPRSSMRATTYLDAVDAPPAPASGKSRLTRVYRKPNA